MARRRNREHGGSWRGLPRGEPEVAAAILLSGVTNVPRIKRLQQVAIEAQDNIEDIQAESEENLEELVEDDEDELEPLF